MNIIPRKRRLKGLTNYTKRRRLLEGRKPRIVIRKTNKYIIIQYVESARAQDTIKTSVISKELLAYGWPKEKIGGLKSLAAAYLSGLLFGKKIKSYKSAILDTGLIRSTKGSKIYSAVKGIVESGFDMPHNEEVFPEESRINTDKTKAFYDKIKSSIEKGKK